MSLDSYKEKGLTHINAEHFEATSAIAERLKVAEENEVKCQKQYSK